MADIDVLDRIGRLEQTLLVLVSIVHNGANEEGKKALDATGFAKALGGVSGALPQQVAA
jgi:hypothetical protein